MIMRCKHCGKLITGCCACLIWAGLFHADLAHDQKGIRMPVVDLPHGHDRAPLPGFKPPSIVIVSTSSSSSSFNGPAVRGLNTTLP
jgi:hypothetical protein